MNIELMWQSASSWVECIVQRVVHKVVNRGHVDVGKTIQPPSEVGRVVVGSEYAAELSVENVLTPRSVEEKNNVINV